MKKLKLRKNKKCLLVLGILVLGLFLPLGITLGRYAYFEIRNFYLASKNFYFNSDKLSDIGSNYQVDNWSGADSYVVTFNMNSYKNNKVYAESDISYDISYSCSSEVICESTKDSSTIYTDKHTDSFSITVTPEVPLKDGDSVWLEVTAKATSPYEKTLKGKLVIKVGKMGLSYEIEDVANRPYLEVNITNTLDFYTVNEAFDSYNVGDRLDINTYLNLSAENKEKCSSVIITIHFDPNVVLLDMTTSAYLRATSTSTTIISNYNYINELSFKVDALSSEVVKFYKQNTSKNYTYPFGSEDSTITVSYN